MFPNPSNGQLNIKFYSEHFLIEIFDITGRLIFSEISNSNLINVDVSKFKGIAIVKATNLIGNNNDFLIEKIVIQ